MNKKKKTTEKLNTWLFNYTPNHEGLRRFLIEDKCYCPFLCQLENGGSFYTASTHRMKRLLYPVTVICWDFVFLSVDASSVFFVRSDKMRRVLGILLVCTALRFLSFLTFFLKFFWASRLFSLYAVQYHLLCLLKKKKKKKKKQVVMSSRSQCSDVSAFV